MLFYQHILIIIIPQNDQSMKNVSNYLNIKLRLLFARLTNYISNIFWLLMV